MYEFEQKQEIICYSPFYKRFKFQKLESSNVGINEQFCQMFSKLSLNTFVYINISQSMRRPNLSATFDQWSNGQKK